MDQTRPRSLDQDIVLAFIGEQPSKRCDMENGDDSSRLIRQTMRNLSETEKRSFDVESLEFLLKMGGATPEIMKEVARDFEDIKGGELNTIIEDYNCRRASLDSTVSNILSLHRLRSVAGSPCTSIVPRTSIYKVQNHNPDNENISTKLSFCQWLCSSHKHTGSL